jgi:hypothetical protein
MQFVRPAIVKLHSWHPKTWRAAFPSVGMNPTTFVRDRTCWIKSPFGRIDAGRPQSAPAHARDVHRNGRPSGHLELAGSPGNAWSVVALGARAAECLADHPSRLTSSAQGHPTDKRARVCGQSDCMMEIDTRNV